LTVRLAHLSDILFGGENSAATDGALRWLEAERVDLLVVSGDLTRLGATAEFRSAAAWLAQSPAPTLVTPGNHDAPYVAVHERVFTPFRRFGRWIGPPKSQSARLDGAVLQTLNSARGAQPRMNWSKGQVAPAQVAETVRALAHAPAGAAKVVVCHHPLTEMLGGPMTARVWGGARAACAFAEAGVDLVLSGHIHAPFVWPLPYGDARTYAVGAGTLSVRERGVPPGFNLVEIERAAIRVAALAWSGSHYEPYRSWSLDRR
jgi:3',5'-cyclic AMP phosphodiesterase CpdA